MRRAADSARSGIAYVDCGTAAESGIVESLQPVIGGEAAAVESLRPVFEIAGSVPPIAAWGRVGPAGAGHFSKMVHNGIEYGLMQACGGIRHLAAKTRASRLASARSR